MEILLILLVLIVILVAYVQFAPSKPKRWHVDPTVAKDPAQGGVLRKIEGDLVALDTIIQKAPRVRVLCGSVVDGHITYIARSKIIGFPDYITVKQAGSELVILSRLRFGKSDLGVNSVRLDKWIDLLLNGGNV